MARKFFIDRKLIEYIRINIHRLINGEAFLLHGFNDSDDQVFIVSGWFDCDVFELPYSDAISRLGCIIYGDDLPEKSDVMGFTNESRIMDINEPILFFQKPEKIIVKNLFFDLYDRFSCLYINRSSKFYYNQGREELLSYPLNENNDITVGDVSRDSCIYIDHYVDTRKNDNSSIDLCVGIFRNTSLLHKCINQLLSEPAKPDFRLTRNFQHLCHPIYTATDQECPLIFKPRESSLILDAQNRIRLDIISCQPNFYFYHYNVDRFNDWGWGCAYRSIQTILSWFIENYNITSHVLSIEEIQTVLKKIDFAHEKLQIGSKSWIGCFEANSILGDISGGRISCRIFHARTMEEIETYFLTAVKDHFVTCGAPVMVGAGNYAYTITGVSPNEKSVFILDPHYCEQDGGSDLDRAISKGFIGLKDISKFFDFRKVKGEFINIMLPRIY